jgi:hypothetical protein
MPLLLLQTRHRQVEAECAGGFAWSFVYAPIFAGMHGEALSGVT